MTFRVASIPMPNPTIHRLTSRDATDLAALVSGGGPARAIISSFIDLPYTKLGFGVPPGNGLVSRDVVRLWTILPEYPGLILIPHRVGLSTTWTPTQISGSRTCYPSFTSYGLPIVRGSFLWGGEVEDDPDRVQYLDFQEIPTAKTAQPPNQPLGQYYFPGSVAHQSGLPIAVPGRDRDFSRLMQFLLECGDDQRIEATQGDSTTQWNMEYHANFSFWGLPLTEGNTEIIAQFLAALTPHL